MSFVHTFGRRTAPRSPSPGMLGAGLTEVVLNCAPCGCCAPDAKASGACKELQTIATPILGADATVTGYNPTQTTGEWLDINGKTPAQGTPCGPVDPQSTCASHGGLCNVLKESSGDTKFVCADGLLCVAAGQTLACFPGADPKKPLFDGSGQILPGPASAQTTCGGSGTVVLVLQPSGTYTYEYWCVDGRHCVTGAETADVCDTTTPLPGLTPPPAGGACSVRVDGAAPGNGGTETGEGESGAPSQDQTGGAGGSTATPGAKTPGPATTTSSNWKLYGGLAAVGLAAAGAVVYVRRKKKSKKR